MSQFFSFMVFLVLSYFFLRLFVSLPQPACFLDLFLFLIVLAFLFIVLLVRWLFSIFLLVLFFFAGIPPFVSRISREMRHFRALFVPSWVYIRSLHPCKTHLYLKNLIVLVTGCILINLLRLLVGINLVLPKLSPVLTTGMYGLKYLVIFIVIVRKNWSRTVYLRSVIVIILL